VGDTVTIVGFGSTDATLGPSGWENVVGGGIKRYTTQTVERIDLANNDLFLLGFGSSGCPGDSGGPMLVELADGSWRVAGVASTAHPDAFEKTGEYCGYGLHAAGVDRKRVGSRCHTMPNGDRRLRSRAWLRPVSAIARGSRPDLGQRVRDRRRRACPLV
jgi:hypothetical protein